MMYVTVFFFCDRHRGALVGGRVCDKNGDEMGYLVYSYKNRKKKQENRSLNERFEKWAGYSNCQIAGRPVG